MTLQIENMFDLEGKDKMLERIDALALDTTPQWGQMSVGQMLAHCNVAYEIVHEPGKHAPPGALGKLFARLFAKGIVVGNRPYGKGSPTAPIFIIDEPKDFETEKTRLISFINKTFEQGEAHYEGLENMTFGKLSAKEWNTMFSKHLDHHLRQFGV